MRFAFQLFKKSVNSSVRRQLLPTLNAGHQKNLRAILDLDIAVVAVNFAIDCQDNSVIDVTLHARIFRHEYAHQFAQRCCFHFERIGPTEGSAE